MNKDVVNKTEYIHLLNRLDFKIIKNCNEYDLDCYLKKWDIVKEEYTEKNIKNKLNLWLSNTDKRESIEEYLKRIGKFATPYILNFLIKYNYLDYSDTKALYRLVNNIKSQVIFKEYSLSNEYLIKEYFAFYHSKYLYYYQDATLINKIKIVFFTTQFAIWVQSAFSMNFGAVNNKSIYKLTLKTFIRTLLTTLLMISLSYYFTILIILKVKRKKYFLYKVIDKILHLFAHIHPLMIIVVFSILIGLLNLSNREKLIFYILSLFIITFFLLLKTTQSIIIIEKSKDNILALGFYGIKEAIIFKRYIYKDITALLLKKIRILIIPISFYTIILEYLLSFNGLGKLFLSSLIEQNYELLRTSILFIGIAIIIIKTYIEIIIFINLKEINKYERNY